MTSSENQDLPIQIMMLIDDDLADQMLYKRIMKRAGLAAEALYFDMATDALAYLLDPDTWQVDLIFLDINMPAMDGFEFLEALTNAPGTKFRHTNVIMLTTSARPDDQARAKAFDLVKDFRVKPMTVELVQEGLALCHETRAARFANSDT